MFDSPESAAPVNSGEPLKTIASRAALALGRLHLGDHVLQEQERPVVDPRQPGTEPARVAERRLLVVDVLLDRLPFHAERRVGQHVVVRLLLVAVVAERVPVEDRAGLVAKEHLRPAGRPRLWVQFLPPEVDPCVRIEGFDLVFRGGQHAAGSAGGVEDVDDLALAADRVPVRGDQQVHHQVDDLARGEVLAGGGVRVLVELADQVLEHVAHVVRGQLLQVLHRGEPADDLEQDLRLGHPGDLVVQVEPLDDLPDVLGEAGDVVPQVLRHLRRVRGDRREVLLRRVVERQLRRELQRAVLVLDALAGQRRVTVPDRLPSLRHHRVEPSQHCQRQDHLAVLVAHVVAAEQVRDRPDVGRHPLMRRPRRPCSRWPYSHRH